MSSAMMPSLTDSEVVTGRCGLGVASTCERRTGTWQHSAGRSASGCESVRPCCTCSQAAAVAEDEVGMKSFRYGVGALAQALQMSRFAASAEAVRLACAMSRAPRSFRLRTFPYARKSSCVWRSLATFKPQRENLKSVACVSGTHPLMKRVCAVCVCAQRCGRYSAGSCYSHKVQ